MLKILLVTEVLNPPYDEGIKKTVYNLFLFLNKNYNVRVLTRDGFTNEKINIIETNSLFLSNRVHSIINQFRPDVLIYFPFQSSTFASYLRLRVLKSYLRNNSINIFIALQPKPLKSWQENIIRFIKPSFALTPSPILKSLWDRKKINNKLIPLLTDLAKFKPLLSGLSKTALREKYNLPVDKYIISHMGHLNENRNLRSLIPLQESGFQLVIIGSSSTPKDSLGTDSLKSDLLQSGIIILDGFIENIEEIYQLSDLYIFPVSEKNGSIGMPLSILEARACSLPVLTTDFGSIKAYLKDDNNGIYFANPSDLLKAALKIKQETNRDYSLTNVSELNSIYYKTIKDAIEGTN